MLTPSESIAKERIDLAVKEQWINPKTGTIKDFSYVDTMYEYKIAKGTIYYEGPVGTQGGVNLDGLNNNQIFVPESSQQNLEIISTKPNKSINEDL